MVIQNRLMFKLLFSAAAIMHICFVLMFYNSGTTPLIIFNIFSVILYVLGIILTSKVNSIEKHILSLTIIVYAEVSVNAVLSTVLLGFEPCFLLYAVSILPMCTFTLSLVEKKAFLRCMVIMPLVSAPLIIATLIITDNYNALSHYPLSFDEIKIMRLINIIFNLILVFGFAFLFVNQTNGLLKKISDSNDQLNFMATHDALTGLFNRHSLWKYLAGLHQSGKEFCIFMGDIDNFKNTNDTFGHDCGDLVLKKVTEVITSNIKESDMACRWGGEEILVIMVNDRGSSFEKVSEIRKQISRLGITHDGKPVPTTMTFGFAHSSENTDPDDVNLESLISLVDKRLYVGKRSGKNIIISE